MDGILNLPLSLCGGRLKNPPFFPKSKYNMANLFENTSLWVHVKVSICYANLENIVMQFHIMLNSESISRGVENSNIDFHFSILLKNNEKCIDSFGI